MRSPLCANLGQAHRLSLQAFPVQSGYAHVLDPKAGVLLPTFSQTQHATEEGLAAALGHPQMVSF